jgi:hypothetical protein
VDRLHIGTASAFEIAWTVMGLFGLVIMLRLLGEARIDHAVQSDRYATHPSLQARAGVLTARRNIVLDMALSGCLALLTVVGVGACLRPSAAQAGGQLWAAFAALTLTAAEWLLVWVGFYLSRSRDHIRDVLAGEAEP